MDIILMKYPKDLILNLLAQIVQFLDQHTVVQAQVDLRLWQILYHLVQKAMNGYKINDGNLSPKFSSV